jgi:hypothetical protein
MMSSVTRIYLRSGVTSISRSLHEGEVLLVGSNPPEDAGLRAEGAPLPTYLRLLGTSRGVEVQVGSRNTGAWLVVLDAAMADLRPAFAAVDFDAMRACVTATTASGAKTCFIATRDHVLRVPEQVARVLHLTGGRFDEPAPGGRASVAVSTRALLFIPGHVLHIDPPLAPAAYTGDGAHAVVAGRAVPIRLPRSRGEGLAHAIEQAPGAHWITRSEALGSSERARSWLSHEARADDLVVRSEGEALDPFEVIAAESGHALRRLVAIPPPPLGGAWPGWLDADPDAAELSRSQRGAARAIEAWSQMYSVARREEAGAAGSLLDLVDEELSNESPTARVEAWMRAAQTLGSRAAMDLAASVWLVRCLDGDALEALDARGVALLVAAALQFATIRALTLPGTVTTDDTTGRTKRTWLGEKLATLAAGRSIPSMRASDPVAHLRAVDEHNKRVRMVSAHALIYATAMPSRATNDGREFALLPDLRVFVHGEALRALETMARERRYLDNQKVVDWLKARTHKKVWLEDALRAHAVAASGVARHWQLTAAWLRASRERPVEGLARVLDGCAR